MKSYRIKKVCPYCILNKRSYVYKTSYGLLRHVLKEHALKANKESWNWNFSKKISYLRVYAKRPSKFHDFKINGRDHLEALLDKYCREEVFNPSMREMN